MLADDFFSDVGVPCIKLKIFYYPNAPALSPTSGHHQPTANYPNNVSTFRNYPFHHGKILQMNNNSLPG